MKKTLATLLAFMLVMSMVICVPFTASAFNPDNYKAQIKSISVGAPITGLDGNKYLPVDVHFTANDDLGDSNAVFFLEGYLKGALAQGGDFEGISGLGMTLMGPLKPDALEGMGSNAYSWQWSEGYGEGVLKYNIPLKGENDTQSVEQSQATGQQEVNVLQPGDKVNFQIETVMNSTVIPPESLPAGGSVFSNEAEITIEELSKYPKRYEIKAYDTTEPETEETTVEATTAPATDAETTVATESTEPITAEPTEATTSASEPETTEAPEPTTEPAPTGTTSSEIVVNDPTEPDTGFTYSTVAPTTPDNKPDNPSTEATTSSQVVTPTEPSTGGDVVINPSGVTPTQPVTVKPVNDKSVSPKVSKKANTIEVKLKAKAFKAKSKKKTVIKAKKVFKVKKAIGKVTYKKISGNKKIAISKSGRITIKKGLKKGKTYKLKVRITAKGNDKYMKKKIVRTIRIKIK